MLPTVLHYLEINKSSEPNIKKEKKSQCDSNYVTILLEKNGVLFLVPFLSIEFELIQVKMNAKYSVDMFSLIKS